MPSTMLAELAARESRSREEGLFLLASNTFVEQTVTNLRKKCISHAKVGYKNRGFATSDSLFWLNPGRMKLLQGLLTPDFGLCDLTLSHTTEEAQP